MSPRARTLLIASLAAIPCLAYTVPCFGHNGRDAGLPDLSDVGGFKVVDIFSGITVTTDPRTGVRTYTQTGDVPPNPARASSDAAAAANMAHGVDFWVDQSFAGGGHGGSAPADVPGSYFYGQGSQDDNHYDYSDYWDGYYPGYYGGYGAGYGYGRGGGRHSDRGDGGHGNHGGGGGDGGRPGRPGGGGGDTPHGSGFPGLRLDPGVRFSPPPGPAGGGVGSPPPYYDAGVGAPPPPLRYNSFGGSRRR